jgi:hypothetical protein
LYLVNFAIFQSASQGGFVVYGFLKQRAGGSRFQKNDISLIASIALLMPVHARRFVFMVLKKDGCFFSAVL